MRGRTRPAESLAPCYTCGKDSGRIGDQHEVTPVGPVHSLPSESSERFKHDASRARWLAPASTAIALAALSAFPGWAVAGNHGWGGQTVAIMAVPVQTQQVQTQYVTTTPVVATTPAFVGRAPFVRPLFATRAQLMTVNSVAAPTTMTSYVTTASPMVTTSYVVQAPATVSTTAPILTTSAQGTTSTTSPQVNVSQFRPDHHPDYYWHVDREPERRDLPDAGSGRRVGRRE